MGRRPVSAPPKLLLVDDEPALADFVAKTSEMCGYQATVTGDDTAFRAKFLEDPPAMVALDLGMPGMDGIELLRFLAEQKFAGPVLIISGFDRRVLESAFRLGEAHGLKMVGPLEKPARIEELEAILERNKPRLVD